MKENKKWISFQKYLDENQIHTDKICEFAPLASHNVIFLKTIEFKMAAVSVKRSIYGSFFETLPFQKSPQWTIFKNFSKVRIRVIPTDSLNRWPLKNSDRR